MNDENLVKFLVEKRPLTDDEIAKLWPGLTTFAAVFEFARRIERAHGIYPDKKEMLGVQADVC